MQMEKPNTNTPPTPSVPSMPPSGSCQPNQGTLPGTCAPMVFPFVAMQEENPVRYSRMVAMLAGTLFPGLDLPFKAAIQAKTPLPNTALAELMALDFAVDELGLYLTTHPTDSEALELYWTYVQLANEGRQKYQKLYGPLLQTDRPADGRYAWLNDPWPWERGGSE